MKRQGTMESQGRMSNNTNSTLANYRYAGFPGPRNVGKKIIPGEHQHAAGGPGSTSKYGNTSDGGSDMEGEALIGASPYSRGLKPNPDSVILVSKDNLDFELDTQEDEESRRNSREREERVVSPPARPVSLVSTHF